MRGLGASQDRVLDAFLAALEGANRRDLARFLLRAASPPARPSRPTRACGPGRLQMGGQRLADRAATYQAATSLLRHLDRLAGWARWARGVWRFDDEFAVAQLYLSDWEQYQGDDLVARAQAIVRNLDPMRQAAARPSVIPEARVPPTPRMT